MFLAAEISGPGLCKAVSAGLNPLPVCWPGSHLREDQRGVLCVLLCHPGDVRLSCPASSSSREQKAQVEDLGFCSAPTQR